MTLRQTRRQGSGSTETCLTLPVGGLRLVEVVQRPAGEHDDLAAAPLPVVVGRDAVDICRLDHVELAGSDDRHIAAGAAVVSCERAKSESVVISLNVSSCAGARCNRRLSSAVQGFRLSSRAAAPMATAVVTHLACTSPAVHAQQHSVTCQLYSRYG